jgi:hypothetical protein
MSKPILAISLKTGAAGALFPPVEFFGMAHAKRALAAR